MKWIPEVTENQELWLWMPGTPRIAMSGQDLCSTCLIAAAGPASWSPEAARPSLGSGVPGREMPTGHTPRPGPPALSPKAAHDLSASLGYSAISGLQYLAPRLVRHSWHRDPHSTGRMAGLWTASGHKWYKAGGCSGMQYLFKFFLKK